MSVAVIGLDHRRASLDVRERVALGTKIHEALDFLGKSDHIAESVVLSTCMRTEVYVDALRFHGAVSDVCNLLVHFSDLSMNDLNGLFFELHDEAAYRHLFRVASGVESAVIGESEVLGQVARAWETSRAHGSCRSVMGGLFRHAVGVGKRVRNETVISRGITSIGQAAVVMAAEYLGDLAGKHILVVGAGEMGEAMASAVRFGQEGGEVFVANRTRERAEALAQRVGGEAIAFDQMKAALSDVDLVLTSTGAPDPLFTLEDVELAMTGRAHRPLVFVDMALPRDVDSDVSNVSNVSVLDLENLRAFTAVARLDRQSEVQLVEAIIEEEVVAYCADTNERLVAPLVAALRERAELLRSTEIERYRHKLGPLEPAQEEAVHALTKSMLSKLLHDPTVKLKAASGTPEGERMADAVRALFEV